MKYDCVVVFHKCANLMPYFKARQDCVNEKRYASERLVRLILLVRYERDQNTGKFKTMCRIRCPINPFPVKGEFEAPSMNAVKYSLINLGWVETEAIAGFMLK